MIEFGQILLQDSWNIIIKRVSHLKPMGYSLFILILFIHIFLTRLNPLSLPQS